MHITIIPGSDECQVWLQYVHHDLVYVVLGGIGNIHGSVIAANFAVCKLPEKHASCSLTVC